MHATETYHIHDFVTVRTNADVPIPEAFTGGSGDADHVVEIERRPDWSPTPPARARRLASHRFWVDDDTVTVRYPSTPTRSPVAVRIGGLGTDRTRVVFTPAFRDQSGIDDIVEGVLTTALLDAGVALIHAGAVVDEDGRATVLTSMGRMGKTSTILTLLRESAELGFMGDNVLLVDDDGAVYSWPATLGVFPGTAVEDDQLPAGTRRRVRLKRWIARSELLSAALLHAFSIDLSENVVPDAVADRVVDHAPIDRVFVLNGGRTVDDRTLATDAATARIATGTDMELDPSEYHLSLYAFAAGGQRVHPSVLKERRRSLLADALADVTVRELFADGVAGYVEAVQ
ncbi:hypothetical protein [Halococcoides cellulosivorans]|uniref:Uncharacterized protein n=1 Tax=Halococcoides cellulosivorans TaxID=1679096 RepID=A0A2R4WXY8_9EURY|nr:hypothetical protein [Halococcoides cellulosivorans]AWB26409.1 hypothetical protein HARCEL1_01060 [Halococcoides cellulosivorans]